MDLLSPSRGWVVGVTSLERTTDGGRTFQRAGEPSGHALVRVDFVSADVGFGLTTTGQLVQTSDAGSSWAPGTLPVAGGEMCFASPQVGYLADQSGNVFATADGGTTWQETELSSLASGSLAWSVRQPGRPGNGSPGRFSRSGRSCPGRILRGQCWPVG